jgi:hypothetical protein
MHGVMTLGLNFLHLALAVRLSWMNWRFTLGILQMQKYVNWQGVPWFSVNNALQTSIATEAVCKCSVPVEQRPLLVLPSVIAQMLSKL